MAPLPQEQADAGVETVDGDSIVISGMSGSMPGCNHLQEFSEKLYNKENFLRKEKRWTLSHPELVDYYGILPDLANFDAQFFKMVHLISSLADPIVKKAHEHTFQSIFDAGINPLELSGKNVGVFIAVDTSERELNIVDVHQSFTILGVARNFISNRLSYWLNSKGPSATIDAGYSGALVALEKAELAIKQGQCDCAIVGAARLLLTPQSSLYYSREIASFNRDGKVKSYDQKADGPSLSEAVSVIFLQKYKDARRVYATLCHSEVRFSDEYSVFGPYKKSEVISKFLDTFYNESKISPSEVEYVEGVGIAIPEMDKRELKAIDEALCNYRRSPLLVGSVSSSIGHTGAASGLCSIIKILLAYQKGKLAASLNCEVPHQDVAALREGRMRVITTNTPFQRSYAAVNNYSIAGQNGHALFKGTYKAKDTSRYHSDIPYLVTASGRLNSSVTRVLNSLKDGLDPEEISLLHDIYRFDTTNHMSRGYAVFDTNDNKETVTLYESAEYYDDARRPLWFVYSGMGSQWAGMGTALMRIPVFAEVIMRCHKTLEPKGVDLVGILTSSDPNIFDNILHSFIGIAAIQIGLTDVLHSIGLQPDMIIGHSVGELGCAYADGTLTAEQMIKLAYSRGLVSIQTPFIKGSMAAIGVGAKELSKICPPEIVIACHNGPESCTISGPAESVRIFVKDLTAKGIFAKEVNTSNIAYHSRYIADAGPRLLELSQEIITEPKQRSGKWLSTSIPKDQWESPFAKYSSPEYFTNNLLNIVLFEEVLRMVPHNAVLVEIAPHALLQAILKRSLPKTCTNIPLTRIRHSNNVAYLLDGIGKIYCSGYNMDLRQLYPRVEYPVSTETRSLAHLVEWANDETWSLFGFNDVERKNAMIYRPIISCFSREYNYLRGHIVDGKLVLPFATALVAVWDTLAFSLNKPLRGISVQFSEVLFHRQPELREDQLFRPTVICQRGSGRFEVISDQGLILAGVAVVITHPRDVAISIEGNNKMKLSNRDVYKLQYERGFDYRGAFRSINTANSIFTQAEVNWQGNWVILIDGIMQLNGLRMGQKKSTQPHFVKRISIDIIKHSQEVCNDNEVARVGINELNNYIRCGGISVEHLNFKERTSIISSDVALKAPKFVPHFTAENIDMNTAASIVMQILSENLGKNELQIYQINPTNKVFAIDKAIEFLQEEKDITINLSTVDFEDLKQSKKTILNPDVVLVYDLLNDKHMFQYLYTMIPPDTFVINQGIKMNHMYPNSICRPLYATGNGVNKLELCVWRPSSPLSTTSVLSVYTKSDLSMLKYQMEMLTAKQRLVILTSYPEVPELKHMVKEYKQSGQKVYVAMINKEEDFEQLPDFDLIFNVYFQGKWGGEYLIPVQESSIVTHHAALKSSNIGDPNSLHWEEEAESNNSIAVHYAGLNVNDAKRVLAEIPVKTEGYGMDFSGINERGERVMGIIAGGAASKKVSAAPDLLWPVPKHWSLEDAATVPLPYCLAFYCLVMKYDYCHGIKILVHGGTGALGMAVISIALANGHEVFTTVSSVKKKRFLRQVFPELPENHIGNSRNDSFKDLVLNATNGHGVDLIISCMKGDLKTASLSCCASFGLTLDTNLLPAKESYMYGLSFMTRSRSYIPIDFSSIFSKNNTEEMKQLQKLVSEGIARGYVRPLPRVAYEPDEVCRAFRLLAASRHQGRVLLRIIDPILATPGINLAPQSTQVVVLDDDGFGLQLVELLVNKGVKNLHLITPNISSYLDFKVQTWQKIGIQIYLSEWNINNKKVMSRILEDTNKISPVEGIFFVLTAPYVDEERDKVIGILSDTDTASRNICPTVRHFVVITDTDNIGHDVCRNRFQSDLPSLALLLPKLAKFQEPGVRTGVSDLRWRKALNVVEKAIASGEPSVTVYLAPMMRRTILEEVARIPGLSITSATIDKATLEQIGVDGGRIQEVCNLLESKFNIVVNKETLPEMTIATLKSLLKCSKTQTVAEENGLKRYIKFIEKDETVATYDLILMSTLGVGERRGEEYDTVRRHLCIIPGLEGNSKRFEKLCEQLKLPAAVLQPDLDVYSHSIQEIAQQYVKVMMKKMITKDHFYLLGYEFGVLVALEMAIILESYGLTGTVYLLGGTANDIRSKITEDLKTHCPVVENDILLHVLNLVSNGNTTELEVDLCRNHTWEDKLQVFTKAARQKVSNSIQFLSSFASGVLSRLNAMANYTPNKKVLSKVILLRCNDVDKLDDCPDLNVAAEYVVNCTLENAINTLDCDVINEYLHPEDLSAFEALNLCENYILI